MAPALHLPPRGNSNFGCKRRYLMETAKVDVRKLQLLNDRITQCLAALSQVRLPVHGLPHPQPTPPLGATAPMAGYVDPRFSDPRFGYGGYGMTPVGQGF